MNNPKNGKQEIPKAMMPTSIRKQIEQQEQEQRLDRVNQLVAGKVKPPNEFAVFIVGQISKVSKAGEDVYRRLSAARKEVKELEVEGTRLAGIVDQYLMDLEKWDRPVDTKEQSKEAPPKEGDDHVETKTPE